MNAGTKEFTWHRTEASGKWKAANRADLCNALGSAEKVWGSRCVPAEVPGIMFLSGGQTEVEATANLDAINRLAAEQGAPPGLSHSPMAERCRSALPRQF